MRTMRAGFNHLLIAPGAAWLVVLFLGPMLTLLVYSVWQTSNYSIVSDFTTANYVKAFTGAIYYDVTLRTVRIAVVTTLISLVVGYPIAYYLARNVRRHRIALLMLVIMPLWTSYLVRTFAWLLILGRNGVVNQALGAVGLTEAPLDWLLYSEFAVTLALVHIYVPFMVLPIYAVLEKFDGRLLEAARDLGAGPVRSFVTVTLPISIPGIVAGSIFVFVPAMGAYVTPELLGGTKGLMLGNVIAQQFGGTFEYPFGSALTIIMVVLVGVIVAAMSRFATARKS